MGSRTSAIFAARGELARVRDGDGLLVLGRDLVDHRRRGRDDVEPELAAEPLGDDLEVQQAEEAGAEPEAEGDRGLGLVDERGIRELQLVERLAQLGVVAAVDRVEAREHHRQRLGVARERLGGGLRRGGDRVADLRLAHVLHAGDEVADLADAEALGGRGLGGAHADLEDLVGRPGRHHLDALARVQVSVDHAHVGDHAAVAVVDGVEDHGPRRGIRSADRRRDALDDAVEQLLDADARLARDPHHVVGRAADEVGELLRVLLGLGRRQVDLVQHRDDLEVVLEGEVEVREGLRLDALRGVDEQDRALARGERAGDLVAEVDVARRVDHVQRVRRVADLPGHAHGLALDGDAALALDVHAVEVLRPHVAVG